MYPAATMSATEGIGVKIIPRLVRSINTTGPNIPVDLVIEVIELTLLIKSFTRKNIRTRIIAVIKILRMFLSLFLYYLTSYLFYLLFL